MKAFILAGGFGTRLREVVHGRPKVLAMIQGRPFLEHLILYLRGQGISEIVLGVGYLASYVRERFGNGRALGVKLKYSEEPRPLGTAGAIRNAARHLTDDFLVLNGDTFIDVDVAELRAFHDQHSSDVTIVTTDGYYGRGGLIQAAKNGRVRRFEECPDEEAARARQGHANAGMYIFNPRILPLVRPHERSFLERDLFPVLLREKYRVFAFPAVGDYIDIGSPDRYAQAQKVLQAIDDDG